MTDIVQILNKLRRPQLLIRAARFGIADYNRNRDLTRLMRVQSPPTPVKALNTLIAEEAKLEETRQSGDASYSVSRHVEILIAVMAEARLLPTAPQSV
jgi:hypothetical protein